MGESTSVVEDLRGLWRAACVGVREVVHRATAPAVAVAEATGATVRQAAAESGAVWSGPCVVDESGGLDGGEPEWASSDMERRLVEAERQREEQRAAATRMAQDALKSRMVLSSIDRLLTDVGQVPAGGDLLDRVRDLAAVRDLEGVRADESEGRLAAIREAADAVFGEHLPASPAEFVHHRDDAVSAVDEQPPDGLTPEMVARAVYQHEWRVQEALWLLAAVEAVVGEIMNLGTQRWLVFTALGLVAFIGQWWLEPKHGGGRRIIARRARRIARDGGVPS
jgi:hypothetical protein